MKRRVAIAGSAAAVLAVLGAVVLFTRGGDGGRPTGEPVLASTQLSPELPAFADRITADLRVLVDRRRVDPSSIRVAASFSPYRQVRAPERSETATEHSTLVRYRYVLDCLDSNCLPRHPFVFPRARVSYGEKERSEVSASWPLFLVAPRVRPDDVTPPRMRDGLRPLPSVSYRVQPVALELAFGGAAVLLMLAAGGLVARSRPRPAPVGPQENGAVSPLVAALMLARQAAAAGDPVMQRKALERLASELRLAKLLSLARSARRLAWSERKPQAQATEALADDVVREAGMND
jgi:hypothetical protein